jgi:hypothetical protein
MDLLKEGIESSAVVKTDMTRKLTVDGLTRAYPVYKVRLDLLYYNDQNDRIATWISAYKAEHGGLAPDTADREMYNSVIEGFIVESNPEAIKKTQTNIELVDQREPGVTLADGRVIDGNRRLTCLRRLNRKTPTRFGYFETVILDRDLTSGAKQIKMLELAIQHGEESRVDYNPVDRLVGVYNDIIDTGLLTVAEYARSTNETETEVKNRVELAKLMIEFLEFINAPKQFYIAREMQIVFPLEELSKLMKKCRSSDEAEDLKIAVFTNILMQTSGDMGRFVRNIKSIVGTEYQAEFLAEQCELAAETIGKLPPVGKVTSAAIRDGVRADDELHESLSRSMEKALTKAKKNETRNRPIALAEKATSFLEGIDLNILSKLNDSEIRRLERQLSRLEEVITEIREKLE